VDNKEEEFFRMSLLCHQLQHKKNLKIMKLDSKKLYKQVKDLNLPFFEWHHWLKKMIEQMQFE